MNQNNINSEQVRQITEMYSQVLSIINKYGKSKEQLLAILLDIQEISGTNSVDIAWAEIVAKELDIPISKVNEVLTFYAMFSTKSRGKYVIEVCNSSPCRLNGSDDILKLFEKELDINVGQTTEDKVFTLIKTSCIGACDISPAAKIRDKFYGNLNLEKIKQIIKEYRGDHCE